MIVLSSNSVRNQVRTKGVQYETLSSRPSQFALATHCFNNSCFAYGQ